MFVPAFYSVFFDIAVLGVALTARVMSTSFSLPITCSEEQRYQLEVLLLTNVFLWVLITLVDIIVAISALTTNMFEGNSRMPRLIYARISLTVVVIIVSSVTTAWIFRSLKSACFDVDDDTRLLDNVSVALIVCGWLHVFFALSFLYLSFSLGGNTTHVQWTKRFRCLCFCCYKEDGESDILGSIAKIFTEFFNVEGIHVVPSDIFVGMALIEASQKRRKKAGEAFYQSEGSDRWIGGAYEPPNLSPLIASAGAEEKQLKVPFELRLTKLSPNLGLQAARGEQPALMREDWLRIAEAKHFARYANGAYGWMLYTFDHMSCLFKCSICDCGCGSPPTQHVASGCCGGCGCHWSHNAFLLTTGLRAEDVLFVHLISEVGSPVYYIAVDREKRALVIAVRGTLSISDAITDMYARVGPLDAYGYPGHYTHAGILANAVHLRKDILSRGIVAKFLASHPDYYIQLVGHSLGAGTSAVLTLILKDDFPGVVRRCVCMAPPLAVDPVLAQSAAVRHMITTIIYDHDIIPQLGLRNLFQMKTNMVSLFNHAAPRKWQIMRASFARQHSKMFMADVTSEDLLRAYQLSVASPHSGGKLTIKGGSDVHGIASPTVTSPPSASSASSPPPMSSPSTGSPASTATPPSASSIVNVTAFADESSGDGYTAIGITIHEDAKRVSVEQKIAMVDTISLGKSSSASELHDFERDLQPMSHCGRIYHMVPRRRHNDGICGCCADQLTCTIYPASPAMFQEIVIASSMFSDHLPRHYTMDEVDLPHDVDLTSPMSPASAAAMNPFIISLDQPNTTAAAVAAAVTTTTITLSSSSSSSSLSLVSPAAPAASVPSPLTAMPVASPTRSMLSSAPIAVAAVSDYNTF